MPVAKVAAFGWENCARLANDHAELIITLDVGPRILSYQAIGGSNVLRTFPAQLGKGGEASYQVRGGHRVWVSPENEFTYAPDNGPVRFAIKEPDTIVASAEVTDPRKIRKEMTVSLAAKGSTVRVEHRAVNEGPEPVTVGTWGLTVMAAGGWQIIPQPELVEHREGDFQPDRVIVPWRYTDLSDSRWKIGRRFWFLRPELGRPAAKVGFAHRERWVAHVFPRSLFIKSFDFEDGATYPDLGCNYETFTKSDFVELESLGPLRTLAAGESASHMETWHLFDGIAPPDSVEEENIEVWLQPFLSAAGLLSNL